jgi:hypothetical protein
MNSSLWMPGLAPGFRFFASEKPADDLVTSATTT